MKLTFLGTRGEIDLRTRPHFRHSSLLVAFRRHRVMIDCGADWLGHIGRIRPAALLLTHAHSDHAGGLRNGAPVPVYATAECWAGLGRYPIRDRRLITTEAAFHIGGIAFEAFALEHSLRAPAVGYRITAGRACVFYAPDIASIEAREAAWQGVGTYIGDGASIRRPILRRRGNRLIGHASVRMQIDWCRAAGIHRFFVTHCGSEITGSNQRAIRLKLAELGRQAGVDVRLARDGMVVVLR